MDNKENKRFSEVILGLGELLSQNRSELSTAELMNDILKGKNAELEKMLEEKGKRIEELERKLSDLMQKRLEAQTVGE